MVHLVVYLAAVRLPADRDPLVEAHQLHHSPVQSLHLMNGCNRGQEKHELRDDLALCVSGHCRISLSSAPKKDLKICMKNPREENDSKAAVPTMQTRPFDFVAQTPL